MRGDQPSLIVGLRRPQHQPAACPRSAASPFARAIRNRTKHIDLRIAHTYAQPGAPTRRRSPSPTTTAPSAPTPRRSRCSAISRWKARPNVRASVQTASEASGNFGSFVPALSADGAIVAFAPLRTASARPGTACTRVIGKRAPPCPVSAAACSTSGFPSVSGDGRFVAYECTGASSPTSAPLTTVVVRDLATGADERAGRARSDDVGGDMPADLPADACRSSARPSAPTAATSRSTRTRRTSSPATRTARSTSSCATARTGRPSE